MVGIPVEKTKVTYEDLSNQLVKQLSTMTLEISLVRAENDKLRKYIDELLALRSNDLIN